MKKTSRRTGFTLIELLVVIAIISIMAAILFPVFARARENARRASCLSNLKQIGLGVMMYTQDYDERYPEQGVTASVTDFATTSVPNWIAQLQPYAKSWQIFTCPSATSASTSDISSSYFGNGVVFQRGVSMAAIDAPANIILAQEFFGAYSTAYIRPTLRTLSPLRFNTWIPDDRYSNNHFDGGNLIFADGHAKWRKLNSICAEDFGLIPTGSSSDCGVVGSSARATAIF